MNVIMTEASVFCVCVQQFSMGHGSIKALAR